MHMYLHMYISMYKVHVSAKLSGDMPPKHGFLYAGSWLSSPCPPGCWPSGTLQMLAGKFLLNEGMEAFMGTSTNYKANKKAIFSFISRNGGLIVKGECKVNVGRHHWDERQTWEEWGCHHQKKAIDRGIPSSFQSCWIHIYRAAIEMVYKWSLNIN